MIDLHVHTNASSDGVHSPEEIFERAATIGLVALAFADHDGVGSLDAGIRLSDTHRIPFVPAVELGSYHRDHDVHILGYFIDHRSGALTRFLMAVAEETARQTARRVGLLNRLGFTLDVEDVARESAGRAPTGRSFLSALVKREENRGDVRIARYTSGDRANSPYLNFYLDFLGPGKPAWVPLDAAPASAAVAAIRESGGVAIVAHPGVLPDGIVDEMIGMGVAGLEAYSGHHDGATARRFVKLCEERGLVWTAGSDFHGKEVKPDIDLGVSIPDARNVLDRLREAHLKRNA
jgi:predicted metal-dependent phosphoesterase TrpH